MLTANMKMIAECADKLAHLGEKLFNMPEMKKMKIGKIAEFSCLEGYEFRDENGNVINATKIVLEKKKDVDLTQEQINAMVHDSCVSFCEHCGCGVPRDTCTSLGTCDEHDEYRKHIRTYLEKHKK